MNARSAFLMCFGTRSCAASHSYRAGNEGYGPGQHHRMLHIREALFSALPKQPRKSHLLHTILCVLLDRRTVVAVWIRPNS
jgi:hypothetical protein